MKIKSAEVLRDVGGKMEYVIRDLLPESTCFVEVQKDAPFKEHPTHTHPEDEVLHILEGQLYFTINETEWICNAGDRLFLPKETPHSSKAGKKGCLYVISINK